MYSGTLQQPAAARLRRAALQPGAARLRTPGLLRTVDVSASPKVASAGRQKCSGVLSGALPLVVVSSKVLVAAQTSRAAAMRCRYLVPLASGGTRIGSASCSEGWLQSLLVATACERQGRRGVHVSMCVRACMHVGVSARMQCIQPHENTKRSAVMHPVHVV